MTRKTRERQYQRCVTLDESGGREKLGLMSNQVWIDDPRRLVFTLSRYKFVAKMFEGRDRVLEIGCGDGFATRIVLQAVGSVTAVDFDPVFIDDAKAQRRDDEALDLRVHDLLQGPIDEGFDGAFSLDVFEHIDPREEDAFLANMAASLKPDGVAIIGIPSLESQAHASPQSKQGHVNCKSGPDFASCLRRHFLNVFLFSMNDEVVHTGFSPMAHYLIGLCCTPRGG